MNNDKLNLSLPISCKNYKLQTYKSQSDRDRLLIVTELADAVRLINLNFPELTKINDESQERFKFQIPGQIDVSSVNCIVYWENPSLVRRERFWVKSFRDLKDMHDYIQAFQEQFKYYKSK